MSYEAAPATKMLATHCAACSRPLLDADSVTAGVGPECRRKHGVPSYLDEETRARANKLIHQCAREDVDVQTLHAATVELALLGCIKLADRISKRAGRVVITADGKGGLLVRSPYSDRFLSLRRAQGSIRTWWDREARATGCYAAEAQLMGLMLREAYGDVVARVERPDHEPVFVQLGTAAAAAELFALEQSAPKPTTPPVTRKPAEPKWHGTPAKVPGGWGVQFWAAGANGEAPEPGDVVEVKARNGKTWLARLDYHAGRRNGLSVWATRRLG